MKCSICGKEYDQTRITECPVCKFHPFFVVGDMDEGQKNALKMAEDNYRRSFFGAFEIAIVAYEWAPDEREILVLDKTHKLAFESCSGMTCGVVNWMKEPFARLEGDSVELNLSVKKNNASEKEITVNVAIPKEENFWYVGISFEEGMKLQLHLKAGDTETVSELIDIL